MLLDSGAKYSIKYIKETPIEKSPPKKPIKKKKKTTKKVINKTARKEAF